jgi:hemoglobin
MGTTNETLYEHAGGNEGLHRLEKIFYARALADPFLNTSLPRACPLTWTI